MTYILDCTLRDGGYYNGWSFSDKLISQYLDAMVAANIDVVELGLRSLKNNGFKGACAFTTDEFIRSLNVPESLSVGVMVNANELLGENSIDEVLSSLFPAPSSESPVDLVRVACHVHEFEFALPAASWLKRRGYKVGFNLMQVADRSEKQIKSLAKTARSYPLDVLYFADSMGSLDADQVAKIIGWLKSEWKGALGIHTHDNLGLALSNTLCAINKGVTWVDSTVTGMGRGPGNARTEELIIEVAERNGASISLVPLMGLIRQYFKPMQQKYGWGTNPYYYLAGKYRIHPTYVQEMLGDARYSEEDVLAVIAHLKEHGGTKFNAGTLDAARHYQGGGLGGEWCPAELLEGREVLLLGTGPGVEKHRLAIESFIKNRRPVVLALNTQRALCAELIDYRVACHPVRLLADCSDHVRLPQPLITPFSMLPTEVKQYLSGKKVFDFGLRIEPDRFEFSETYCTVPTSLVMAYAFAVAVSGKAQTLYLAGFDGYSGDDPRNSEMNKVVKQFQASDAELQLIAITPTKYDVAQKSVYGMVQ